MVPNLNSIYILPLIASCLLLMGFETNKDSTIEGNLTIEGKLDIKDDSKSVIIGTESMSENTSATDRGNVAIGPDALSLNDSGKLNLALGALSMSQNISGKNNVGLGSAAMQHLIDGDHNIGIGFNSGKDFTGDKSIFIGSSSSVENGHTDAENQIVIGAYAKGRGANTVVLGSDTVTASYLKGNVTILKGGSQGNLEIDGSLTVDGNSNLDSLYVGKNLEVTKTLKVKERAEILSLYTKGTIHFYPNEGGGQMLNGAALKIQFEKLDDAGNNEYLDDNDVFEDAKISMNRVAVIGDGAIDDYPAIEFIKIDDHMVVSGDLNVKTGSKLLLGGNEVTAGDSDSRWKKDIKPLESSLDNIAKLRGVNYQWNRDQYPDKRFSDKPQIGVIAQEVELVFPQVVNTDSKGYKYVDYNKLVAPLIEAVKELNQKNQTQQALIANLTARLERLEEVAQ